MKVTLVMFRGGERRDFDASGPSTIVGRRQECTLRIPTKDVSRRHCEILVNDRDVSVKDLGSANGTYVNGKRVAEHPLSAGDKLRIGPVIFMVQINGHPAKITPHDLKPPPGATPAAAPGAEPELDEDDLFELDDNAFDLDDPITAMNGPGEDDDDDEPHVPPPKKK